MRFHCTAYQLAIIRGARTECAILLQYNHLAEQFKDATTEER
jgi:hypothetical protein